MGDFESDHSNPDALSVPGAPFSCSKKISRKKIINRLNYFHFTDRHVDVWFQHPRYDETVILRARPEPCLGDSIVGRWAESQREVPAIIRKYRFKSIVLQGRDHRLMLEPTGFEPSERGFLSTLPEHGFQIPSQRDRLEASVPITARLLQNGVIFEGRLVDFSAHGFQVELTCMPCQSFAWIKSTESAYLTLGGERETFFAADCTIAYQSEGQQVRRMKLSPAHMGIQRFLAKEFRSKRQSIEPVPYALFRHPFTDQPTALKMIDLSGSGFSVAESADAVLLMPGLILPEVRLCFAGNLEIACKAQVIYRKAVENPQTPGEMKVGLVFMDIDPKQHMDLLTLLWQNANNRQRPFFPLDMDALWEFFFETGFIYPDKYAHIQEDKEIIKQTYRRLYTRNPKIARHFTHVNSSGQILAHMAILRLYNASWMIHHHTADTANAFNAGLNVLYQISRFVHESHRFLSVRMQYVFCYYRPKNRFPHRVFGGVAEYINDRKACLFEPFAYRYWHRDPPRVEALPFPWDLAAATDRDLRELALFCREHDLDLMIQVLDLAPDRVDHEEIEKEYAEAGLTKKRFVWALRQDEMLCAIFMANISDAGINLSELNNCLSVFVIDPQPLTKRVFDLAVQMALSAYTRNDVPVLIYPESFMNQTGQGQDKAYHLWMIDIQYGDVYNKFLDQLIQSRTSGSRQSGADVL